MVDNLCSKDCYLNYRDSTHHYYLKRIVRYNLCTYLR